MIDKPSCLDIEKLPEHTVRVCLSEGDFDKDLLDFLNFLGNSYSHIAFLLILECFLLEFLKFLLGNSIFS